MIEYSFNSANRLLIATGRDNVTIDDISDHYITIRSDERFSNRIDVLIDCRSVEMKVDNRIIGSTRALLEETAGNWETIKEAIIVTEPYTTMIAMLFERMSKGISNYQFRVFSTEKAAELWLKL